MYSVLQNAQNGKYNSKPFPYIIIDNALPLDYYDELDKSFPDYDSIINNSEYNQNFAYRTSASHFIKK